jgi:hypothetical protein
MKVWLQSVGSPMSVIEKADFEPLEDENHVAELISKGTFDVQKCVQH